MRAVQIVEFGGPEVLKVADVDEPDVPAGASLLLTVTGAGVNFADTHAVENTYLASGAGSAAVHPGPRGGRDHAALAILLQGTTAWHLLWTSGQLQQGETGLVHAAAGGIGTIAVQLAKASEAKRVIAAASSETKQ